MSDLIEKAGLGNPNVIHREGKPPVVKPNVSSDASEHHPYTEVSPDDIRRNIPPGAERDPTFVPLVYLNPDRYYRWVNKRKIEYRMFQGYEPVLYAKCPVHRKSPEGWVQLGDTVFMSMPRDLWELKVKGQEEYWTALYKRQIEKAADELAKAGGHPFIIEPDGKEVD